MGEPHRIRRPGLQDAAAIIRTCHERTDGALATPLVRTFPGKLMVEWAAHVGGECRRLRVTAIGTDTEVARIVGRAYVAVSIVNGRVVEGGRRADLCSLVRAGIAWMLGEEEPKPW